MCHSWLPPNMHISAIMVFQAPTSLPLLHVLVSVMCRFLCSHPVPVVLGPEGRHYLIDHHHLTRAMYELGIKSCYAGEPSQAQPPCSDAACPGCVSVCVWPALLALSLTCTPNQLVATTKGSASCPFTTDAVKDRQEPVSCLHAQPAVLCCCLCACVCRHCVGPVRVDTRAVLGGHGETQAEGRQAGCWSTITHSLAAFLSQHYNKVCQSQAWPLPPSQNGAYDFQFKKMYVCVLL